MSRKSKRQLCRRTFQFILAVLVIFGIWIIIMRSFSYEYNQQADYKYTFNPKSSKTIELALTDNQIHITENDKSMHTAFIGLDISYTLKGFASQPSVKMIAGNDTLFQNFECRVKGLRYINISGLVQKGAQNIQFEFSGCKTKDKIVKLICFQDAGLSQAKILILAAHPDDAEIAAYGLYASNHKSTFIATITAGDAGSMRYNELYADSTTHYIKKGKIRVWNSITIPQLGSIPAEKAINLGYFDASLKQMHTDTTTRGNSRYIKTDDIYLFRSANCALLRDSLQTESTWRSLVNDLKHLLQKEQPTIVVTTYPAIDYHNDHKYTTIALLQAINELQYNTCELWLYTNHYPLTKMYPDGNIGSAISLPPYFGKDPLYFDRAYSFPLSKTLQADKAIALDAMNDLRPNTQYRNTKSSWQQTKNNFLDKLFLKESDYFRRSVRSNELFFVVDTAHVLDASVRQYLIGQTLN